MVQPAKKPVWDLRQSLEPAPGDKLAENRVLIEFIDFCTQCGVDLTAGVRR